jgi:hypothetical protein
MAMGKYQVKVYTFSHYDLVRAYSLDGAKVKADMIYQNHDSKIEVEEIEEDA